MMRSPVLILMHFFVFLQLLAVLAHARTLSSEKKIIACSGPGLGGSLCGKLVSISQNLKPAASPSPSPGSPSGGKQSPRPSSSSASAAELLCSSPCLAASSRKDISHPCSAEEKSLCDKFWKRPSLSPPSPQLLPPSLSLASS